MSNEIKVGDKVRVREDAPKVYLRGWGKAVEYNVYAVDGDAAIITYGHQGIAIPTKYLVKVEEEKKEAKFKVGDRVRVKGYGYEPNLHKGDIGEILDTNDKEQCFVLFKKSQAWIYADCLEPYTESKPKYQIGDKVRKKKRDKDTTISYVEWHGTWQTYVYGFAEQEYGFNCHKEGDITLVSRRAKEPKFQAGDCVKISFEWGELPVGEKLVIKRLETIDCRNAYMYSIEGYGGTVIESMLHPYSEPTEQTEAEKKPNIGSIKIPVEVDLTDSYWDAYTADLAKEVALKVANKFNDPEQAAEYAVQVAESVVEGLKRK